MRHPLPGWLRWRAHLTLCCAHSAASVCSTTHCRARLTARASRWTQPSTAPSGACSPPSGVLACDSMQLAANARDFVLMLRNVWPSISSMASSSICISLYLTSPRPALPAPARRSNPPAAMAPGKWGEVSRDIRRVLERFRQVCTSRFDAPCACTLPAVGRQAPNLATCCTCSMCMTFCTCILACRRK